MKKLNPIYSVFLAGAVMAVNQTAGAQNLIVNSNFSTGDFTGWMVAETGTGGSPKDYGVTSGPDGGVKVPEPGNTYGAYFNPAGGTMDLEQTVDFPVAGTYLISCAMEPVINDTDTLTILVGGTAVLITNFEIGGPFVSISATITAQAGSQVVDFQFTPGSGPMFFDDAGLELIAASAPTVTPCAVLGLANSAAVIGLDGADILNFLAEVNGNEFVSRGGALENLRPGEINGNVVEAAKHQYLGDGRLAGTLTVDPTDLATVNADARAASAGVATMTPTQVLGGIRRPTLITGNGGVNVIDINGNITDSVLLKGGTNDVFFVNVSGTILLGGFQTLGVTGGVTAGAVLYNLTGSGYVEVIGRNVVDGTILAPNYSMDLVGEFNGAIIGGGGKWGYINLIAARVNQPDCGQ